MSGIRVLPVHLVNKIAAGEVIERPASIVKELVENAVDAGATRIEIDIEDGGRKLVRVSDNGCGMSAEDLALAFVPHATSKISGEDDLAAIATMGFRGEALASIASVSHALIRTRRREDNGGLEISAAGDSIGKVKPAASAAGTTVEIRDLFFNTPARRKFLKAAATEFGHITEQLARIALPCAGVAFRLSHNGRPSVDLPAAESTSRRAADLFGAELAEGLLNVHRKGDVEIRGLIGTPAAARATGKWQYFFLNGRYIRDRLLSHALKEAYRGRVDPSRFPSAFLFIRMDPAEVDVNVHPTKIEVRFRDSQKIHGELLAALKDTLNRANLTPDMMLDAPATKEPLAAGEDAPDDARKQSLRQALADFFKSSAPPQPRLNFGQPGAASLEGHASAWPKEAGRAEARPSKQPADDETGLPDAGCHGGDVYPAKPLAKQDAAMQNNDTQPEAVSLEGHAPAWPQETVRVETRPSKQPDAAPAMPQTLQVHNTYLIASTDDGVVIVDQHALHERILYNDLHARIAEGALLGQRLLIPQPFSATAGEADLLARHADLLARLGIEIAPFGPKSLAVQQFPTLLAERGVEAAAFLRDVLDRLGEDENADPERLLEDLLETIACKAAVKAGDPLSPQEIDALLARRAEADKGSSCPHGRPTTLKLTLRDLQKQFQRI